MLLSIVIPLYDEQAVLPQLVARLDEEIARLECESEASQTVAFMPPWLR